MGETGKPVFVQTFVAQATIETFDAGVLVGFARLDKAQGNALRLRLGEPRSSGTRSPGFPLCDQTRSPLTTPHWPASVASVADVRPTGCSCVYVAAPAIRPERTTARLVCDSRATAPDATSDKSCPRHSADADGRAPGLPHATPRCDPAPAHNAAHWRSCAACVTRAAR